MGTHRPNLVLVAVSLLSLAVGAIGWVALRHTRTAAETGGGPGGADQAPGPGTRRAPHRSPVAGASAAERAADSVREALRYAPERLSTMAALPPFDQTAFERDPQEYLARVEPARCFQTAQPGPQAVALQSQTPNRAVVQGEAPLPLWVKTTPNAPVTFTAFDGGEFKENGLPSVTVQADAKGLASAHYFASRGIDGDVNIVAGSPLAVGVQRFMLRVVHHPPPARAQ